MKIFVHNATSLSQYKKQIEKTVSLIEARLCADFSGLRIDLGKNESRIYFGCATRTRVYLNSAYTEDLETIIATLIHELVHVWQFATGRLSRTASGKGFKWQGEYRAKWMKNELLSPWEIEAVVKTNQFFDEVFEEIKKIN